MDILEPHLTPAPQPKRNSLLYLEFGSVSFKASYFPKGADNQILPGQGSEVRKHGNLLCLSVYRDTPVTEEELAAVVEWMQGIYRWATVEADPPCNEVLVVATAAFRDMEFFHKLGEAVRDIFGAEIMTLDGYLEAQLLMDSYRRTPGQFPGAPSVHFDLGGGSLEIVHVERESRCFTSLDLGSGRVTAWLMDGLKRKEVRERIESQFVRNCQLIRARAPGLWYGTGGAVKSFGRVFNSESYEPIYRFQIRREFDRVDTEIFDSGHLKDEVLEAGYEGIASVAPEELDLHRKKIYVGGLEILDAMCTYFDINAIRLDNTSVRGGVVRRMQLLRSTTLR